MNDAAVIRPERPPVGWLPVAVVDVDGAPAVRWADFAGRRLTEPFFEDSARAATRSSLPYYTALDDLAATDSDDARSPDGFVFHLSRCGSTLVSQMLAAVPAIIAVSEAPPIDNILRRGGDVPTLRAMVRALGRLPDSRYYVVKLDCWHMPSLPLFRHAFPMTPWIFLFRDPVEVLVSHARMPGLQMIPGLHPGIMLGLDPMADDYRARVLAPICAAALEGLEQGGGRAIAYPALPHAMFTTILPHLGITIDAAERAAMTTATERHAKRSTPFTPDAAAKRAAASPDLRDMAERHVGDLYRRLLARAAT